MSGHSKWHNIRLKKEKMDSKRGKMFTRVSKEIMLAVKEGGPDPDGNHRLAAAIQKAKEVNMPKTHISRAIDKIVGDGTGSNIEEVTYEGYGPHGVAVLVETATDNKNRTVPEIRNIFSKYGGAMGEAGCVAWIFDKKGLITVKTDVIGEDELLELILEAGAEDLKRDDDEEVFEIYTEFTALSEVKNYLQEKNIPMESSDVTMIPKNEVKLNKAQAETVLKMMELFEENDDVQDVHANFNIPEEILAELGA